MLRAPRRPTLPFRRSAPARRHRAAQRFQRSLSRSRGVISASSNFLRHCFPERSCTNLLCRRQMMFAERHHRTRLRTFGAFGMLRDKTHLVSDGQLVETATGDAVTMEIDLGAIGGHDEAAILLGKQARDPPMIGYCMQLHIAAPLANVVFEQL